MSEPSAKARELVTRALELALADHGLSFDPVDDASEVGATLAKYLVWENPGILASLEERAGEVLAEGWIGVISMDGDIPIHLRDPEDDHRLYQGQPVAIVRRQSEEPTEGTIHRSYDEQ